MIGLVDVVIFATSTSLMLIMQYLVFHTKLGVAMRAVSFNTETAALMGIHVDRVVSFTFVLGSTLAAAAGFLIVMKYPSISQPAHTIWVLLGLKAFESGTRSITNTEMKRDAQIMSEEKYCLFSLAWHGVVKVTRVTPSKRPSARCWRFFCARRRFRSAGLQSPGSTAIRDVLPS